MNSAIAYTVGGILGAVLVGVVGNTVTEASLAMLVGGMVIMFLDQRGA